MLKDVEMENRPATFGPRPLPLPTDRGGLIAILFSKKRTARDSEQMKPRHRWLGHSKAVTFSGTQEPHQIPELCTFRGPVQSNKPMP